MKIIELTHSNDGIPDLIEVLDAIAGVKDTLVSVRVGIDPMDNGLKFSVNWGTWSPPIYGELS